MYYFVVKYLHVDVHPELKYMRRRKRTSTHRGSLPSLSVTSAGPAFGSGWSCLPIENPRLENQHMTSFE